MCVGFFIFFWGGGGGGGNVVVLVVFLYGMHKHTQSIAGFHLRGGGRESQNLLYYSTTVISEHLNFKIIPGGHAPRPPYKEACFAR